MHERYRAFNEEFRLYMARRGGWPADRVVGKWFRDNENGLGNSVYSRVKKGGTAAEKFFAGFLRMLDSPPESPKVQPFRHGLSVLWDFLRERGVERLTQIPVDSVLSHITGPPVLKRPKTPMIDYLRRGVEAIGEFLAPSDLVTRYVQGCASDADIREAVDWVLVCIGQSAGPGGAETPPEQAALHGEAHVGIAREEFVARVIRWHRFNPWTVVFAREDGVRLGTSIVLPLTESAYDDVLESRRSTDELEPEDFTGPSRNIVLEACAECPTHLRPADANPSRSLRMALAMQCGALARVTELPKGTEVRFLTFASTPRNRDRLIDSGFKSTGRLMARNGFEMFTRAVPPHPYQLDPLFWGPLLMHFAGACNQPPP